MSLNKYVSFVILLLCLLILSNGVYAENTNNTDIGQDTSNEDIEQTNVNNYNDLKNAINHVKTSTNKKHEINLKENIYKLTRVFSGDMNSTYEKDIIINGNHSTIDGQNQYGFLIIPGNAKVSINNLTIINTERNFGPALKNTGNLILENVNFENNIASDAEESIGGGAIFTEGSVNITNCTFKNNGGNIDGSAIFIKENKNNNSIININNCEFQNNTSIKRSTIKILGQTTTNIHNSTFTTENANYSIIENTNSKINITNCSFTNVNSTNIIANGYECYLNNILIYENNITDTLITNHNLILNNSRIYNNHIKSAIDYTKNVTIENSMIYNNHINESLIQNTISQNDTEKYVLKINNSNISNNTAHKTCGINNKYENSHTFIDNSLFINNTSLLNEGILYDFNGNIYVNNNKFYNNTSEDLFKGTLGTFKQVTDNEYKGNYLKIYLKTISTTNENNLIINGSLETDKIYNTTVQSGILTLNHENTTIYEENVTNDKFIINYHYSNDLKDMKILYEGINDFRDTIQDIEVTSFEEEYEFKIINISNTYTYGEYITFDLNIKNSGSITAYDIILSDILPNELVYVNSTDTFDNENNEYYLNELNVNENKTIKFYLLPKSYEDLILEFNISNNKQDKTYHHIAEILFIKPTILIDKVFAHPGDIINISARIDNYKKNNIDNITFLFNYKKINAFKYDFNENILTIENYNLNETLVKKDYMIEIICSNHDLEDFSNKTKISVIKYVTHSVMNINISNSYLNLSLDILDEKDNPVNGGSVILKVNGETIKSFKVNNGKIILCNYKLKSNYQNEYNLSLTYTGNNKYNLHNNKTTIKEDKRIVDFLIDYNITEKIQFSIKMINNENILPESGYVAIKVNNKTIIPKMDIQEEYILTYDNSSIIHNITLVYYGNKNFIEKTRTITI